MFMDRPVPSSSAKSHEEIQDRDDILGGYTAGMLLLLAVGGVLLERTLQPVLSALVLTGIVGAWMTWCAMLWLTGLIIIRLLLSRLPK